MNDNQVSVQRTTARDFFLHLGVIASLYFVAGNLISLIFDIVNAAFPDRLDGYVDPYSGSIRFAIASLIIAFPLYIYLNRFVSKDVAANPLKRDLWVRRWLLYFTLFLAGAIVAGDLIAVLNTFLRGELTVRFVLKALALLLITGGIFAYYLREIKSDQNSFFIRSWNIITAVIVVAAIVGGFIVGGSPIKARELRFDAERVNDLRNIQWQIINYWQLKEKLPSLLADLNDPVSGYVSPRDPEIDKPYEYIVSGDKKFSLCAEFKLETPKDSFGKPASDPYYGGGPEGENWNHGTGRVCFERTIDPQLYPPKSQITPLKPIPTR